MQKINFEDLPLEIILEIFSKLSLEDFAPLPLAASSIRERSNLFWGKKFELHFPDLFEIITKNPNTVTDWYVEFYKSFKNEFMKLPSKIQKIFYLVKDRDAQGLNNISKTITLKRLEFYKDKGHESILDVALKINDPSTLNYFYEISIKKFKIETKPSGRTLLYWAILFNQDYEEIKKLISQGSSLDEIYYDQYYPIHLAAIHNRFKILQGLIENGRRLDEKDLSQQTPLLFAASRGHKGIVEFLVNRGADLDVKTHSPKDKRYHYKTPLCWAIKNGHSAIAVFLIDSGAQFSEAYSDGLQPIHLAAQKGDLTVIKKIIELDPTSIEQTNDKSQTPLELALRCEKYEAVMELLKAKNLTPNKVVATNSIWGELIYKRSPTIHCKLMYQAALKDKQIALIILNQWDPWRISTSPGYLIRHSNIPATPEELVSLLTIHSFKKLNPAVLNSCFTMILRTKNRVNLIKKLSQAPLLYPTLDMHHRKIIFGKRTFNEVTTDTLKSYKNQSLTNSKLIQAYRIWKELNRPTIPSLLIGFFFPQEKFKSMERLKTLIKQLPTDQPDIPINDHVVSALKEISLESDLKDPILKNSFQNQLFQALYSSSTLQENNSNNSEYRLRTS